VQGQNGTTLERHTTIGFKTQGIGLVPAHKARMNLATTIWAECQIPNPKQIPMSKFKILDVLSIGISRLDYFIFRLFQALILFGPVPSLVGGISCLGFSISPSKPAGVDLSPPAQQM
jgi:hypothetical protein